MILLSFSDSPPKCPDSRKWGFLGNFPFSIHFGMQQYLLGGSIFSNLLENSLEALQREGGGWLRARSVSTSGYFSLVVGNSCTRPLRSLNGHYLSSKSPGRFGIGLATIQEVAQHYGGNAEFTVENGEFRASIFLPRAMSFIQSVRAPSSPNTAVSTCSGEHTKR